MKEIQKSLLLVMIPFCSFFCLVTLLASSVSGFITGVVLSVLVVGLNYIIIGDDNFEF